MPLVKLSLVFAGIVLFLIRRWNLGLVLLLACVAVGVLFGYPVSSVARDVLATSIDPLTLRLAVSVVLIMTLSELLRETGSLTSLVESLQALIPSGRLVMAALPALVGLLPMVGGAMFSAPMVNEAGDRLGVEGERKTFINYWFRHIWEYVFPLYPSLMLAAALLNLETFQLARATWPLTAAAVASGATFGLIGMPGGPGPEISTSGSRGLRALAASIWPIALVVALSLTMPVDERARLILSLVLAIAFVLTLKRIPLRTLGRVLRERIPWETVAVLFGALIFRAVLDKSGAVRGVSRTLIQSQVPLSLIAFVVPFIAGLLTGLSHAAFSIGFPVVVPLVAREATAVPPGWAAWMMAGAFLGVMCSPLHLCLSLTRIYFDAEWRPIYRRIAPSTLVVAATAAVLLVR